MTLSTKHSLKPLEPRYCYHRPYKLNLESVIEALAQKAGVFLLEWQKRDLAMISAIDEQKQFVHRRVCLSIPRQAGKTTIIEWYVLVLAMLLGARVLWTVHNYQIIVKTLEDFRVILGRKVNDELHGIPWFNSKLSRTSSKTAQEGFWFKSYRKGLNAGCICFSTRTKNASLGNTFDIVVLDEAQEVTTEHLQAILPTTSSGALHNPQYIYMGTPRRAGSTADRFEAMRTEAVSAIENKQDAGALCYIEYGLSEIGDVSDEDRWCKANPSLVEGVANIEAIRELLPQMGRLAFAQDCLGVWLKPQELSAAAGTPLITSDEWQACATDKAPTAAPCAFAVKFSVDGQYFAVAVALEEGDHTHVELVDIRSTVGTKRALADFVKARAQSVPVIIDGRAGQDSLIERVEQDCPHYNIIKPKTADVIAANTTFVDAVQEKTLSWYLPKGVTEPDELTKAVTQSYRRTIGKSGGWGFDGELSAVVEAAALAVWKSKQAKEYEPQEAYF